MLRCNATAAPSDTPVMNPTENVPKYPDVVAPLIGGDGNGFFMVSEVSKCLRKQARVSPEEIAAFRKEAMSGDYDHLLRTCMAWVTVE